MPLETTPAWGEVGLGCVLEPVAGKQLRRLQNETTAAKTGPQAAATQQSQVEPRKENSSAWVLYVRIYGFAF